VNINHYKPLHYVLIILLMFVPLRSVMAVSPGHCDMDDMDMSEMSASMPGHDMHNMSAATDSYDVMTDDQTVADSGCCCCDNDCVSYCQISIPASLIIQASDFSPVFLRASKIHSYIPELLPGTLTPPSRPPALTS
jgi:hypothetical protein